MSLRHCLTAMHSFQTTFSWPTANSPYLLKKQGFPLCTSKALLSRRAVSEQRELTERLVITVATNNAAGNILSAFKSQYCLQLSLLQLLWSFLPPKKKSKRHNTACSYHCCNLPIHVTMMTQLKLSSQYCLQLSLLQLDMNAWKAAFNVALVTILLAVITVATHHRLG